MMIVKEAEKWIGYLEHTNDDLLGIYTANAGKGGCTIFSEIIRKHYRWRNFQGLPWCAVFVHAICIEAYGKEQARALLGKPHPGSRVLARRMKRTGRFRGRDHIPCAGDIIFCHNGGGRISHCGIVTGVDGGMVYSVEGNTHDPSGVFDYKEGGAVADRIREFTDPAIVGYGIMEVK